LDADGVCNHCHDFARRRVELERRREVEPWPAVADQIRANRRGRFDCVIGLSGGVDSSYLAYLAVQAGLRPLAVHLDNGWDSELAIGNVHDLVTKLDLELHTHVVDWAEFRDLQVAYLRAGVVDMEVLTDHAIVAVMFRTALREGVRDILIGDNLVTEGVMPVRWNYRKGDLRNLKAIARRNGGVRIRTLPTASTVRLAYWQSVRGTRLRDPLNLVPYDRSAAVDVLQRELGWRDYGGKHYESFFTRFYQAHILPTKFGIDKRKAHLSSMVGAGLITRDAALAELAEPLYDATQLEHDRDYVVKKLGLTVDDFDAIMAAPPVAHATFPSDDWYSRPALKIAMILRNRRDRRAAQPRPPLVATRPDS
jgi:N-acetyl sugar amidotransferase